MQNNNLTQREVLQQEFLKISPDVTTKDKKDFSAANDISHMTVNKYLRGDVINLEVAIPMLVFFKERVSKRNETIGAIVNL